MQMDDYSGPFQADFSLARLSRQALAELGREYLLSGHLQDRAGLPRVMRFGDDALTEVSIVEWMGASPIYSARMQRALGFEGNDVSTIFKNLQLDIGAPHQFMEFRFDLNGPDYGEFWLERCGPLTDVEPYGEERVRQMCHDVEDPTFDATAAATHPCAKVRAIHRPPRVPAARVPHCRWKVFIDDEGVAYEQHENLALVGASVIAGIDVTVPDTDAEPGGWSDYSGAFDPEFQFEDLSHRALVRCNLEFSVQAHLLARSFLLAVHQRFGEDNARSIADQQWTGIAGLTAERLCRSMNIGGEGAEAIAKAFQVHPCFHPRDYVDLRVSLDDVGGEGNGDGVVRVAFGECPAFAEGDEHSWLARLGAEPHPALDAIARAVNPRASVRPTEPRDGERLAFLAEVDRAAEPFPESDDVKLTKISNGARIVLQRRRPLRD